MTEPTAAPSRPVRSRRRTPDRARRYVPDSRSAGIRQGLEPAVASTGAVHRRAPSLRRLFPVLEPEREAFLRERNRVAFVADPRRVELERRLLDLGGLLALLFLPDPQIGELLQRGRYFPGAGADEAGRALRLPRERRNDVRPVKGEGPGRLRLCPLVRWPVAAAYLGHRHRGRAHPRDDHRRVRYYGYVLTDTEAALRLLGMMISGDLWPEEVEAVRRFLESVHGPIPAVLLDPAR